MYSAFNYDYGDGSLNKVQNGYGNSLYINGTLSTNPESRTYIYGNYLMTINFDEPWKTENSNPIIVAIYNNNEIYAWGRQNKQNIISGFNYYTMTVDATLEEKTCAIYIRGGGATSSNKIGKILFKCDSYDYGLTLSDMVEFGIIKPLVVIAANGNSTSYIYSDILNCYDDPEYVSASSKSYAEEAIVFMVNEGHSIYQFGMYSYKNFNTTYDGLGYMVAPTQYARITLNSY